jgi:hypothetical protein
MEELLINLINTQAFPIAVTAFLLWERSKTVSALTDAINTNTNVLQKMLGKLGVSEHE